MSLHRWLIVAGLVVFMVFVVAHALVPQSWKGQATVPGIATAVNVTYQCGAALGSAYVHGPTPAKYAADAIYVSGIPCGDRRQLQMITLVDVVLGLVGIAIVVCWGRGWPRARFSQRTAYFPPKAQVA
jgi:hypothetical protein